MSADGPTTTTTATAATDALRRLHPLVGHWTSAGEMVDPRTGARTQIAGADDYAWLDGGHFLIHRVDVTVGERVVRVLEVIGEHDPVSDSFVARAFDNSGGAGVMRVAVDADGVWTFSGDGMRATLTISARGDAMRADWERETAAGVWEHWMEMRFTRGGEKRA